MRRLSPVPGVFRRRRKGRNQQFSGGALAVKTALIFGLLSLPLHTCINKESNSFAESG